MLSGVGKVVNTKIRKHSDDVRANSPELVPTREGGTVVLNDELWMSVGQESGVDAVERYLREGGDVDVRHPDSAWTLLHLACEHLNHDLIRVLVAAGADLNARNHQGWTPLHQALDIDIDSVWQTQHSFDTLTFSTVRLLLALGADPRLRCDNGLTIREAAAQYGAAAVARFDELVSS